MSSRYGSQRAAWIADALTPTNVSLATGRADPGGRDTRARCRCFPAFPNAISMGEARIVDALPDAWTVALVSGTKVPQYRSRAIVTQGLAMGLTPNGGVFPPGPSGPGDEWMVDFPTAVPPVWR